MTKAILTLLLVGLTAVPVFAGGQQQDRAARQQRVEIEAFHFKVPWIDSWEEMTAEFERDFPNISVSSEIVGGAADWRTVLQTRFAAGLGPDIFIIEGQSDFELWREFIAPLDDQPWIDQLLPIAREAATFNGRIMAMPYIIEGYGYIYNKDLFAQVGIAQPPRNYSELRAAAQRLRNAGITPFASGFGTWWVISNHFTNIPFAQQPDPRGFIEDLNAGRAAIYQNEVFRQWQRVFDLVLEFSEPNPLTTDHLTQTTMFAVGDVAMIQQGNWREPAIYGTTPDINMGLLPIAFTDDVQSMNRLPVGIPFMFVVNSRVSEERQAAAFEFLNWMVSTPQGQRFIAEEYRSIPAFYGIPADALGSLSQEILAFATEGKTIPWMFSRWPDGAVQEFANVAQRYVAGQLTFDGYLRELQRTWETLR